MSFFIFNEIRGDVMKIVEELSKKIKLTETEKGIAVTKIDE